MPIKLPELSDAELSAIRACANEDDGNTDNLIGGLESTIENGAVIQCFDLKDGSYGYVLFFDGQETKIRLTESAINEMYELKNLIKTN